MGRDAFTAFGPGKVILLGEHAVVYGHPALAGPLPLGVTARAVAARKCALSVPKRLTGAKRKLLLEAFERAASACGHPAVSVSLESDLPLSMGLGSSAAVSVACARVLLQAAGRSVRPERVAAVAAEMERVFHGTPSGIDHTTSALGRLIRYRKRSGRPIGEVRAVDCPKPLRLLIALVGERSPTRVVVAALRDRRERWQSRYVRLFAEIGRLVEEGRTAIESGDLEGLGDAMNVNQGVLAALQLSSPRIDQMVYRLRRMGALGAKLTGAGGDGGAVIGLFREPEPAVARLAKDGVRCFVAQLAGPPAL